MNGPLLSPEEKHYQRARKRVKAMRRFYASLSSFIFVNITLFVIDALTGDGWWFYWVTIFWGLALLIRGWRLFGPFNTVFDDEWEERKIHELMGEKPKRTTANTASDYFEE